MTRNVVGGISRHTDSILKKRVIVMELDRSKERLREQ